MENISLIEVNKPEKVQKTINDIINKVNPLKNVTTADLGLDNVDNTRDVDKPLSILQKQYIDDLISSLVGTVPETFDTFEEVKKAFDENDNIIDALNAAIGNKADKTQVDSNTTEIENLKNTTQQFSTKEETQEIQTQVEGLESRILSQVGNANTSMQNDYNTKISELATPAENGNTAYELLIESSKNKLVLEEGTTVGDLIATVDAENQILTLNGQPTTANNNKAVSITPFTCRTGETWTFSMKLLGGEGTAGTLKLINVADGLWNNAISLSKTSLSVKKTFTSDKTYDAIYYGSQNTSTTFVDFQVQFQAELGDTATEWQAPGDVFKYEEYINSLNERIRTLEESDDSSSDSTSKIHFRDAQQIYTEEQVKEGFLWFTSQNFYDMIGEPTFQDYFVEYGTIENSNRSWIRILAPTSISYSEEYGCYNIDAEVRWYMIEPEASSGGSSSGAPENMVTTDITLTGDVTQEITPNTFYNFTDTAITSLTITFGTEQSGVLNEYMFQFIAGDGFTTLTMPSGVVWLGGAEPTITAGKTYQVSVVNNLAVIGEF